MTALCFLAIECLWEQKVFREAERADVASRNVGDSFPGGPVDRIAFAKETVLDCTAPNPEPC